jgi:hypothetical protein
MKIHFYREFNKDLNYVVNREIKNLASPPSIKIRNIIFLGFLFCSYLYSKPFYIYYKGRLERKYKIEELKKNGEFVLKEDDRKY